MTDNEKLQLGLSLQVDLDAFETEWKDKQKDIQKMIDDSAFKIRLDGVEGLDKIRDQLKEIQNLQKDFSKPLTGAQALREQLKHEERARLANAKAMEFEAGSADRLRRQKAQAELSELRLARAKEKGTKATYTQTQAYRTQSGVLNGLKQFMNSYISLLGGYRLMSNIKQITSEFELQRVSLRAITQDAAFADALFAKIKTTATESPFSTKDLVTYTKQLAAYRIENEQLYGTMNMLADVSAGLGVSMDRLILAYGQVKAASVLRGTELRQFTEAGIPLVDELAKKFSQLRGEVVSTGEVFDLISTRQVPFEMVAEIFKEMTAEGGRFYEMQKKQSESLYGVFENLKDNIQNAYDEIGQSNRGLLMGFGKMATAVAKHLNLLVSAVAPLIVGMGAYRAATVLATKGTLGLATSSSLLAKAEANLNRSRTIGNAQLKLQQQLMIRASAANNRYAIYTIKAATATNVFTRSWYALKAAIIANPLGAVLVGLTAVVSALSAYGDKLRSVEDAQKKATEAGESLRKQVEKEFNLEGYNKIVDNLKEQEALLKSAKKSYSEFQKIFPNLAAKYKDQAGYEKALSEAQAKHQQGIAQLKTEYTDYFGYLDVEKSKVSDLTRGYSELSAATRAERLVQLKAAEAEAQKTLEKLQKRSGSTFNKFLAGEGWFKMLNFVGASLNWLGVPMNAAKEQLGPAEAAVKNYQQQIEALEQASKDANDAMVNWRRNYKALVMQGNMEDQALAALRFGDAVDEAQDKANKLKKEIDKLQRIPTTLLDPSEADNLEKMRKEYSDIITFLKMYNQELDSANKKGAKTKLQELRSEFQMVQKIYKEYEDLRKLMGDERAAEEIKKAYSSVTEIDFLSPDLYKKRLEGLAKAVAQTNVTIRKSSADLTGQQISDIKKWTKEYEEWLKIQEQSGKFAAKAYKVKDKNGNPIGNWTVGWGFEYIFGDSDILAVENLKQVTKDTTMTLEEANAELQKQLLWRSGLLDMALQKYEDLQLTANQYSALLDVVYNTGNAKNVEKVLDQALGDMTKLPEILSKSFQTAAATGEIMPGLVRRTAGRAAMFAADLGDEISEKFSKISVDNIEQLPSYLAMQIQKAIGDVDIDGITADLEAMLEKISQRIKQQQDASDFFAELLGITGNTELATNLTLAVTGVSLEEGGVGAVLSEQLAEILAMNPVAAAVPADFLIEGEWNAANIQKAIQEGELTVSKIQDIIANLTAEGKDDLALALEQSLGSFVDYNKQVIKEVYSTIGKYADFAEQISLIKAQTDITSKVRPPMIDDATWDAYAAALQRQQDEAVASIKFDEFKHKFARELSNLDVVSNSMLDKIRTALTNWLASPEGAKASEADVKAVLELVEKVDDIKVDRNPFKEWYEALEKFNEAKKTGDTDKIEESWNNLLNVSKVSRKAIVGMANAILGVVDGALSLADTLGVTFSDDTMEMIEAFKNGLKLVAPIMTMVGVAMLFTADAAMALQAAFLPLLVATLAISAAFAAISWISGAKVRKANKEIERQEKLLKNLERAYRRLEEIQEDLVGTDWVRNQQRQIANLQKQIAAFEAQRRAEQSKGKKMDEDAIEDYTDKILDAQEQMRELRKEIVSEMAGTNLSDAAKDFAQSWLDAYLSFDDTMGALKSSFKDMMRNMVQNSMMAKLVQKRLEPVFDAIDKAYEDAELTPAEWQSIMDMGNRAIEYIDEDLTHLAEMLDLRNQLGTQETSNLTGIAKGVAQASEETVLTLAGYANSILYYQIWLKNDVAAIRAILEGRMAAVSPAPTGDGGFNVGQLVSLQQQSLSQLQAINLNTGRSADSLSRLEDKIDSIISTAGTSSRKVVNTRLSN